MFVFYLLEVCSFPIRDRREEKWGRTERNRGRGNYHQDMLYEKIIYFQMKAKSEGKKKRTETTLSHTLWSPIKILNRENLVQTRAGHALVALVSYAFCSVNLQGLVLMMTSVLSGFCSLSLSFFFFKIL